jgi:hypothetical protein
MACNKMVAVVVLVVTACLGSTNALQIDIAQTSLDSHAEQTLLGQVQYNPRWGRSIEMPRDSRQRTPVRRTRGNYLVKSRAR